LLGFAAISYYEFVDMECSGHYSYFIPWVTPHTAEACFEELGFASGTSNYYVT